MKLKDEKVYLDWKEKNSDSHGAAVFEYAERWANGMENAMNNGKKLKDTAKQISIDADTGGIKDSMYRMAVKILVQCWVYGEELREWHKRNHTFANDEVFRVWEI